MAIFELYMRPSGGSNLCSGTTSSDVGGGSDSATKAWTAGNFDGTSIFTPTDGTTTTTFVSVGDYVALAITGETFARCIAQVTAVGAGANGTITISTTIKYGTVPTSNSGSRECRVGGSLADLGIVATNAALATGTVPQATRVNSKAGTYANTTTSRTMALAADTTAAVLIWRGYKTVPGDQDLNASPVKGTDIPDFTWTTGAVTITGNRQSFTNISFTSASTSQTMSISGNAIQFFNSLVENTGTGRALTQTGSTLCIETSLFKATTSATAVISIATGVDHLLSDSKITGGTAGLLASSRFQVESCIFDSPSGDAISTSATNFTVSGCSFYGAGGASGNGINMTTAPTAGTFIKNNYLENFTGSGKAAINNSSGTDTLNVRLVSNGFYNNTAELNGIAENIRFRTIGTLASQGFVNPGSQNFAMNAVGQDTALPGPFQQTSVYRGYRDVGAVQHQATGGGGGAILSRVFTGQ